MNVAQFTTEQVNNALIDFVPARVNVYGTTLTAKRLNVVSTASQGVKLFAANMKGKVGVAAREGLFEAGFNEIASSAARGNYKPLAEALALLQGEACYITSRASFEALGDRFQAKMDELEQASKKYTKGSDEKLGSKFLVQQQCMSLITGVHEAVKAVFAQRTAGVEGAE